MSDTVDMVAMVLAILAIGALLCLWIVQGNRRLPAVLLFASYVYELISLTILRQTPYPVHRSITEPFHSYRVILRGLITGWGLGLIFEVIGNVLIFLPLGLVLSRLLRGRRSVWTVLAIGLSCSLVIEAVQYFSYLGIFELDDLFHNTLGALLGFRLGNYLRRYRERRDEAGIQFVLGALSR